MISTTETPFAIAWPSTFEINGRVMYRLLFTNQMERNSKYAVRLMHTNSPAYSSEFVSAPPSDVKPTEAYEGQIIPDVEIIYYDEDTDASMYYVDRKYDNVPSEDPGEESGTINSVAIPKNFTFYSASVKDDQYSQLINNITDVMVFLENALQGHVWRKPIVDSEGNRAYSTSWKNAGFIWNNQWKETVGQIKVYKQMDYEPEVTYNLDAVGTYCAAIALKGLAEYCLNKYWNLQLLAHLCLSIMSGRFEISERGSYVEQKPVGSENPHALNWYERNGDYAYALSSDTVVDRKKTYYVFTADLLADQIYYESISQTPGAASDPITNTAQDPKSDSFYAVVESGAVCVPTVTKGSKTFNCTYYAYDVASGHYKVTSDLTPSKHRGKYKDYYWRTISSDGSIIYTKLLWNTDNFDGKGTVEDPWKFKVAKTYYDEDKMFQRCTNIDPNDKAYQYVLTNDTERLSWKTYYQKVGDSYVVYSLPCNPHETGLYEACALCFANFVKTTDDDVVPGTTYFSRDVLNHVFNQAVVQATDKPADRGWYIIQKRTMITSGSSALTLDETNNMDIYIMRLSKIEGQYYYVNIGNTGVDRTVVLGRTKNITYTNQNDSVIWRAPIREYDVPTRLYTDKNNEHVSKLRSAVNTYLTHYKRALQMTLRGSPHVNPLGSGVLYNIGDIIERLNSIVSCINKYGAGIELLSYTEYNIRMLKLKSNEIADFIRDRDKNPKTGKFYFDEACEKFAQDSTSYAAFLPGDSMLAYEMIFDHNDTWYCYNDLGFYFNPEENYSRKLFEKLDWKKTYPASDHTIGHISNAKTTTEDDKHHYQVWTGTEMIPLFKVLDMWRIAHTWHDNDYSGSMQVISLMIGDLNMTDTYGRVWHTYLEQFTDPTKPPYKAKLKISELLGYLDKMQIVSPIAAKMLVDIAYQTHVYEPSEPWAAYQWLKENYGW